MHFAFSAGPPLICVMEAFQIRIYARLRFIIIRVGYFCIGEEGGEARAFLKTHLQNVSSGVLSRAGDVR
jgi:hypothetical protein